jgi:hypothetical protein
VEIRFSEHENFSKGKSIIKIEMNHFSEYISYVANYVTKYDDNKKP